MRQVLSHPTDEQRKAAAPQVSVWVAANAGAGKTHVLIDRVVRLLLAGATPQSILCLTFTKAAAAEMSRRLFDRLAGWATLDDESLRQDLARIGEEVVAVGDLTRARQLFALAIEAPGGLKIQTIHAFCERLLHLFPVEAGLAPGFRVMDDGQRDDLLEQCYNKVLAEGGAEGWSLIDEGQVSDEDRLVTLIKGFIGGAAKFRFVLNEELSLAAIDLLLANHFDLLNREGLDQVIETIDRTMLARAVTVIGEAEAFKDFATGAILRLALSADAAVSRNGWMKMTLTSGGTFRQEILKKPIRDDNPDVVAWLSTTRALVFAAASRDALRAKIAATVQLIAFMRNLARHYAASKATQGLYDFDDLIVRTQSLLSSSTAAQWVLYKLDAGLAHILVDEAQDTSPEQWTIIHALAGEFFACNEKNRTVFAVGDIKQSIYSFQGADTKEFGASRNQLKRMANDAGKELPSVKLTSSYRSVKEILKTVDVVFAKGRDATKGLGEEEAEGTVHETTRKKPDDTGRFEFWPLVQPEARGDPEPWTASVDSQSASSPRQRLAKFIAAKIKSWIGRRHLTAKNRAVAPGDILVLFQSRSPLFEALIAALRHEKVDVAGADRLTLHENIAVLDLMALAQFALLPDDDHALACLLKSPLVPDALDEDQLLALAAERKDKSLWQQLLASGRHAPVIAMLQAAIVDATGLGAYGFFAKALNTARRAMVERLGPEALDATDVMLDMALEFGRHENASLAAFLHWFETSTRDHKRELDQSGGSVRLMTVHGAKGLDAEIVILADAADFRLHSGPILPVPLANGTQLPLFNVKTDVACPELEAPKDTEKLRLGEEHKRLLYVAMTRARNELYVCGAGNDSKDGKRQNAAKESWHAMIADAIAADPEFETRDVEIGHPGGQALRHGEDDVPAATGGGHAPEPQDVPPWLGSSPLSGDTGHHGRLASGTNGTFDHAAARRGRAIHRLLETLPGAAAADVPKLAKRQGLDEKLAHDLFHLVQGPDLAPFYGPGSSAETPIIGRIDRLGLVSGRVDRFAETPEAIYLLDYKSGRRDADHRDQMALYEAVLSAAYPGRKIRAALLWTHSLDLQWLDPLDLSRALEGLRQNNSGPMT